MKRKDLVKISFFEKAQLAYVQQKSHCDKPHFIHSSAYHKLDLQKKSVLKSAVFHVVFSRALFNSAVGIKCSDEHKLFVRAARWKQKSGVVTAASLWYYGRAACSFRSVRNRVQRSFDYKSPPRAALAVKSCGTEKCSSG